MKKNDGRRFLEMLEWVAIGTLFGAATTALATMITMV